MQHLADTRSPSQASHEASPYKLLLLIFLHDECSWATFWQKFVTFYFWKFLSMQWHDPGNYQPIWFQQEKHVGCRPEGDEEEIFHEIVLIIYGKGLDEGRGNLFFSRRQILRVREASMHSLQLSSSFKREIILFRTWSSMRCLHCSWSSLFPRESLRKTEKYGEEASVKNPSDGKYISRINENQFACKR